MDPINNPTPTPNPMPTPAPTPDPVPGPVPAPDPITPEPVASPVPEPVSNPTPPPVVPSPVTTPPPVNPVINPTGAPAVNPIFQPNTSEIAATDPIMKPEPAKAPDPIEEELKAPMKAAGPVPGSIGSAVSGPANGNNEADVPAGGNPFDNMPKERTQNVPFNDPAMGPTSSDGSIGSGPVKKPANKKTLIALIAVAAVIVVVLIVVLVMQLLGGNSSSSSNTPAPAPENNTPATSMSALSCTRDLTNEEKLSLDKPIKTGSVEMNAQFDDEGMIKTIHIVKSVVYEASDTDTQNEDKKPANGENADEEVADSEEAEKPVVLDDKEADVEYLAPEFAEGFYLVDSNKNVLKEFEAVKAHFEDLAFTCESL